MTITLTFTTVQLLTSSMLSDPLPGSELTYRKLTVTAVQSPMTIPTISVSGLVISPEIMDLQTAEAAFENFTSP